MIASTSGDGAIPSPERNAPTERFLAHCSASMGDGTFVRLVLSTPQPAAAPVERITGRLVTVRQQPVLSLTLHEPKRDLIRNLQPTEVPDWLRQELEERFQAVRLETTERDWQLQRTPKGGIRLVSHRPRQSQTPPRTHDAPKQASLRDAGDWLTALGLLGPKGAMLPTRADKVRQIERYAELLGHLAMECGWKKGQPIRITDMGCGRGYLTFAAWHLLRRQLEFDASVIGVEVRDDLVTEANATVQRLGFTGLEFRRGTIAEADATPLDGLIALHACNTATDDALRRGIDLGCRLVVVAPCCHQELRPQMEQPEPFTGALRHGLFAERLSEWLTDAIRSMHLEWAGYRVKAIEFVASEHTPKNLLLAGIQCGPAFQDRGVRDRIVALKTMFGVKQHALDPLLDR